MVFYGYTYIIDDGYSRQKRFYPWHAKVIDNGLYLWIQYIIMRELKYDKISLIHAETIPTRIDYFPQELLPQITKEIEKFVSIRQKISIDKKRYARINNAMSTIKFIPYLKVIAKPAPILETVINLSVLEYKL